MKPLISRIEQSKTVFLAVNSLQGEKAFVASKSVQAQAEPGFIVNGAEIREWRIDSVKPIDGEIHYLGPDFSGTSLLDRAESGLVDAVAATVRALVTLKEAGRLPERLNPSLILDDGVSVLFLPSTLVDAVSVLVEDAEAAGSFAPFIHPDRTGESAASFTVAALLYRALAGTAPFPGASVEEIAANQRDKAFLPLALAQPDLRRDLAALVDRALAGAATGKSAATIRDRSAMLGAPSLADWKAALSPDSIASLRIELDAAGRERNEAARALFEKNSNRRVSRKRFLRRHRSLIIGSAVGIVAVALIVSSFVGSKHEKHTIGIAPTAVVETYFKGLNALDQELMEECVTAKAGKNDINTVMNLYVINRVRYAQEGKNPFLSAPDWVKRGKPAPSTEMEVFGATDFDFVEASLGSAESTIRVRYTYWIPNRSEKEPNAMPLAKPMDRKFHLKRDVKANRWVIDRIDEETAD
jgi:hypothetical protein